MNHRLLTKLAAARSALEFYAEPKRYEGANQRPIPNDPHAPRGAVYVHDVTRDGGDIARAALSTLAQEPAGQSEANRILAASLTPELVRYRSIDKWNGELPRLNGASALPFIDVSQDARPSQSR